MAIALQYGFINWVYSTPTINKYLFPLVESNPPFQQLNFKNLFQSYFFQKKLEMDEREKEEEKNEI